MVINVWRLLIASLWRVAAFFRFFVKSGGKIHYINLTFNIGKNIIYVSIITE